MGVKECHKDLYKSLFGKALQMIKQCRDPHAQRFDYYALGRDVIEEQEMFDFGIKEITAYEAITQNAKTISIECVRLIVTKLLELYKFGFEIFVPSQQENEGSEILFAISVPKTDSLLLFKEIEPDSFWRPKGHEPAFIEKLLNNKGVSSCKYVYLMYDKAYMQVVGHDDNEDDPGRGYNLYSMKWFFETYFGATECECFIEYVTAYVRTVKEYLGFIQVRALTPNATANFRLLVESQLYRFDYKSVLGPITNKYHNTFALEDSDYKRIREQFIEQEHYLMLVGANDYAESLVTAEWLRDSMGKAGAIDLTVVALGYFKAVEQLLFDLICLHKNEGKRIKAVGSKDYIALDDANISAGMIDASIGSMAKFYKNNLDMFRVNLGKRAKRYIGEVLFDYAEFRNEHLHKENIHDMARINEIRSLTFRVVFLLLGAHELVDADRENLGMPDPSLFDDYYRMCEFVNYHSAELYMVEIENGGEFWGWSMPDPYSRVVDGRTVYSGFYLKEIQSRNVYQFRKEHMPKTIWLGSLGLTQTELIHADPKKVIKLFDNGTFVGPLLIEEDGLKY